MKFPRMYTTDFALLFIHLTLILGFYLFNKNICPNIKLNIDILSWVIFLSVFGSRFLIKLIISKGSFSNEMKKLLATREQTSKINYFNIVFCLYTFAILFLLPVYLGFDFNAKLIKQHNSYHLIFVILGFSNMYWLIMMLSMNVSFTKWVCSITFLPFLFLVNRHIFHKPFGRLETVLSILSLILLVIYLLQFWYRGRTGNKGAVNK